ncbi:MAG: RNA polymerase sigma factor (sigma-70 family) [Saprospiraceae bacterium]|jgi:RNA polymerase sigma factor (sigma-70 family)
MTFEDYINSYKNLLFKIARIYCYNKEEQKDLVQEIVIQLWKAYPKYDSSYTLSTWTYRIALNVCISYVRKTTVRKKALDKYREFVQIDISEDAVDEEKMTKLTQALSVLNSVERAIIMLNLDGSSNKEIAKIIGVTPSNVSTRLVRIKSKLRKEVKQ